jgi:hypothetical protein
LGQGRYGGDVSSERDCRPPFTAVRDILNRHDPEVLLELGGPEDEYDPEAEEIAGRLRGGQPVTAHVLVEVWERWFGPSSSYNPTANAHELATLAAELNGR